jgi:hypothetical protein
MESKRSAGFPEAAKTAARDWLLAKSARICCMDGGLAWALLNAELMGRSDAAVAVPTACSVPVDECAPKRTPPRRVLHRVPPEHTSEIWCAFRIERN